ncbi:ImmA/IrrE family metallo-endopeptidase [Desulfofalx alkaliphila]|uniref:ImmA/IrrE family metallo-endopeptidase n=1 Tax=Desulfofalx alkaliphila TaxID=105483 RepID=UPI0004E16E0C|nr:ImmA/IrrE family metallo-endopeptidase [Desulfofalx alkaliphila]
MLNPKLLNDPIMHRCVLAEELGHHITNAASTLLTENGNSQNKIQKLLDEYRAIVWATNFLVPHDEFTKICKLLSDDELADYFMVTSDYIRYRRLIKKELVISE